VRAAVPAEFYGIPAYTHISYAVKAGCSTHGLRR
jgi:hypothetical protein